MIGEFLFNMRTMTGEARAAVWGYGGGAQIQVPWAEYSLNRFFLPIISFLMSKKFTFCVNFHRFYYWFFLTIFCCKQTVRIKQFRLYFFAAQCSKNKPISKDKPMEKKTVSTVQQFQKCSCTLDIFLEIHCLHFVSIYIYFINCVHMSIFNMLTFEDIKRMAIYVRIMYSVRNGLE